MNLIEAQHIEKVYALEGVETHALRNVSLSIQQGEFVAVMGPSGSGKSTLLHILGFLDRATSGHFFFSGQAIDDFTDRELARVRNEKIGFIFQAFNLLPRTSVYENVLLPLQYSAVPKTEWKTRALTALERVHMSHRLSHTTGQLSGGEKQRVAIARALINNPLVIFADEPTGNLDSKTGEAVMETIDALHTQGHTIVLITHETPTAEYAERIVMLKDGLIASDEKVVRHHTHYEK